MAEVTLYEAAGGEPAIRALAGAWHRRCLADPVVSHAFSHPELHPQHEARLAAYWGEALGGPPAYTGALGDQTHVMRLHSGNGEHHEMDERAQQCFALAMDDAGLPSNQQLRSTLAAWFRWATADLARYPRSPDEVPAGLELPRWSWDGPLTG
jgi:hemoglobin